MRTILDRQVAMLATKKNDLPEKPEDKKGQDKKSASKPQEEISKKPEGLTDLNELIIILATNMPIKYTLNNQRRKFDPIIRFETLLPSIS